MMIGQPYSGKLIVRLDERREDAGNRRLPPTLYFVIGFSSEVDARKVMDVLAKRFARYGLTLHPEKTKLIQFRRPPKRKDPGDGDESGSFDLLGFTHYWGKSRNGNGVIQRRTATNRFSRALLRVTDWCRSHRHEPISTQQRRLSQMLRGHYGYFGITGNATALGRFYYAVKRRWREWLDRRTGRHTMPWSRFVRLLKRYPLPPPIVVHSVYPRAANP